MKCVNVELSGVVVLFTFWNSVYGFKTLFKDSSFKVNRGNLQHINMYNIMPYLLISYEIMLFNYICLLYCYLTML